MARSSRSSCGALQQAARSRVGSVEWQPDQLGADPPEAHGDAAVMGDRLGPPYSVMQEEPPGYPLDLGRRGNVDEGARGPFGTRKEGFGEARKQPGQAGHVV